MLQYAITDRRFFPGDERQRQRLLIAQAEALVLNGIDFLQLREKDLSLADLLTLARELRAVLPPGTRPRLLLNAPAPLAIQAGADGLHLPGKWSAPDPSASPSFSLSAALTEARTVFTEADRPNPILSVSTHSIEDVLAARDAGADLILFGPVFEKRVRGELVRPGVGLHALAAAAQTAHPTPLLALGGITSANHSSCLAAGAAGIAAIRMFLPAALSKAL